MITKSIVTEDPKQIDITKVLKAKNNSTKQGWDGLRAKRS